MQDVLKPGPCSDLQYFGQTDDNAGQRLQRPYLVCHSTLFSSGAHAVLFEDVLAVSV